MAKTYRPYVPEQDLLLPPSLRDWLPADHLVYFVSDVVDAALASLGPRAAAVSSDVPDDLPRVHTDPVLLERAVANLIDNALVHAGGAGLRIEAGAVAGRVDLRVVDHGPGVRAEDRELVFRPFQRLGDSENEAGVGLGLAVARGFVEALGGELVLEDTPGGGTTMVFSFRCGT